MKLSPKAIITSLAFVAVGLLIYNKVPAVKRALGGDVAGA